MKKFLFFCLLISFSFYSCRRDFPKENSIHAKFTDLKDQTIDESHSGQLVKISAAEFSNFNPNGGNTNQIQMFINNIPAPIEQYGMGFVIFKIPVMYLADYKGLSIYFRFNQIILNIIERLLYRPTVTSEIFAGYGASAPDGTFQFPSEMTIDAAGNLYVVDERASHDVIIKVTPTGTTSVFAGAANEFGRLVGIGFNVAQTFLIVSDATAQQVKKISMTSPTTITVLAGSGTIGNIDGTGTTASFRFGSERVDDFGLNEKGQGLAVDAFDNVFVGEKFGTGSSGTESQLRKITPAGVVTVVPNSLITMPTAGDVVHSPSGLTINAANEPVYIGGASSIFQGIARITSTSMIRMAGRVSNETLTDGVGSAATFTYPKALQFFNGLYYIADGSNAALRRMDASGNVITLAGLGHAESPSFCFCPLPATAGSYVMPSFWNTDPNRYKLAARAIVLDQVGGIAVRNANLMYLSDYGNNYKLIWKIRIE